MDEYPAYKSHAKSLKDFCAEAAHEGDACDYKTFHPKKRCRLDPSEDCKKLGLVSMKLPATAIVDIKTFQQKAVKFSAAFHSRVHLQAIPTTGIYNTALVWTFTV